MQRTSLQEALSATGLEEVFCNLSRHSIKAAKHVVECSILDIMHLGKTTYVKAGIVLKTAAALLAPSCVPLTHLLRAEKCNSRILLGLPAIDCALGYGLLVGAITELVGSAGANCIFPDVRSHQLCRTHSRILQASENPSFA